MRNIKTTLRFARNSALLFAAASGMTYMTSCSNEVNGPKTEPQEPALKTASYSVYGANQGRVTNYGKGATRAGDYTKAVDRFEMAESVSIPSDAKVIELVHMSNEWGQKWDEITNYNYGNLAGGSYVIPANYTLEGGIGCWNGHVDLYIAGAWNVGDNIQGDLTVYVLPGGKLNLSAKNEAVTVEPGVTVHNYGDITGKKITFSGKVYSAVDITNVVDFGINSGAELYSKGTILAENVRLNGKAIACAFIANNEITLNDNGTIYTSYFDAKTLTLNASNVVLDNSGVVNANRLNVSNADTRFTVEGTHALVVAKEFNTNNREWPKKVFAAEIALDLKKCMINESEVSKNEFEFQVSSANQVMWVPATGCHGEFGEKPQDGVNSGSNDDNNGDEEDPGDNNENPEVNVPEDPSEPITVPELVKIVDIEGLDEEINHGNHDHGVISATCINFGPDGTAYASYHLRGNGTETDNNTNYDNVFAQKGCIEVINDKGEAGMELGSYMIADNYDFNHLIVDGERIVTVGNAKKKGAFIAALPVDFAAVTGVSDDMSIKELTSNEIIWSDTASIDRPEGKVMEGYKNAGDGNCVVRVGDYYYVATYAGYGPLNLDFSKVVENGEKVFVKTNGSAKYIGVSGDNMYVLALDSYDKTSSTASIYKNSFASFSVSNGLTKYADAIGTVAPVDGKNVLAVDGNDVYACLSKGGLVRVNDGKTWQRGSKVPVNGMAFDDKYVYVANGSFVSVLDKETLKEVCYYHAKSEKSANYIALRNGKIYVAFGEDGIQVYQLVIKEIAQE